MEKRPSGIIFAVERKKTSRQSVRHELGHTAKKICLRRYKTWSLQAGMSSHLNLFKTRQAEAGVSCIISVAV